MSWCQPGPWWLLSLSPITIDPLCVSCYLLNNKCSAEVPSTRSTPTAQACRPTCVCLFVCVCVHVAEVCLCLHQLRSSEKAEWGGVCRARSLTVDPKQHIYVVVIPRLSRQWLLRWAEIFTSGLRVWSPTSTCLLSPSHTHPSCLDTKYNLPVRVQAPPCSLRQTALPNEMLLI